MKWGTLGVLGLKVMLLGMLAFGGLTVVLVQLEQDFVGSGLMTADEFTRSFALASAAPGPNGPIFLSLLGWQTFGIAGVFVLVIAWAVPTLLITHQLGKMSEATSNPTLTRLLRVLKAGAVGLIAGGVLALVRSFDFAIPSEGWTQVAIALVGVVLLLRTKLNPLVVLLGSMLVGAVVI